MSSPKTLARSIGSDDASPKSSVKSNQTCFCTGDKGIKFCNWLQWKMRMSCGVHWSTAYLHPTPEFLLLGWRRRSLKEMFNHLSVGMGVEGLGKVSSTCQVCQGKSQNMALVVGDSDATRTPVESASTPRMGISSPGSGLPCKRFLPQLLGCLCSSLPSQRSLSLWWQVAVRVFPALGGGSSWHWCGLEASSNHMSAQLLMQLCHVFLLLQGGEFTGS